MKRIFPSKVKDSQTNPGRCSINLRLPIILFIISPDAVNKEVTGKLYLTGSSDPDRHSYICTIQINRIVRIDILFNYTIASCFVTRYSFVCFQFL